MKPIATVIISIYFCLIITEIIWSIAKSKNVYNFKETFSNLFIFIGGRGFKSLTAPLIYALYGFFQPYALFDIPINAVSFILSLIIVDFISYWNHRSLHEIKFLWTIHHVHHSSIWMNFTTAFRLNWLGGFISPVFYLPVILLGFPPTPIVISLLLNLAYQFFLHTEIIGQLPLIEGWLNTPSAHRVHHGSNPKYIDKNYGGIFIVWDRLFGTYQPETEKVIYGVTTGFAGHNPFKVLFQPIIKYFQGSFATEATNRQKICDRN